VVHDEKSPYETWSAYDKRRGVPHRAPRPSESFSDYDKRRKKEMANATRQRPPVRAVEEWNFEPRNKRKAKRKALIRGYVGNKIADVKMEAADRAEFYRNLRLMKLQRRKIASEMRVLCDQLRALAREVGNVEHRIPTVDLRVVDETHDAVKDALKAATAAADEWFVFSRQRVYYFKEGAA
jgi:hypothetical protein